MQRRSFTTSTCTSRRVSSPETRLRKIDISREELTAIGMVPNRGAGCGLNPLERHFLAVLRGRMCGWRPRLGDQGCYMTRALRELQAHMVSPTS